MNPIVKFLIHILSLMVSTEEHLNAVIKKAAASKVVKDAEASLKVAHDRAALALKHAYEAYEADVSAAKSIGPVVTPQSVASLVSAAAATTQPPTAA